MADIQTEHRLTALEQSSKQAQERHEENKKSLIAVHTRITDLQKDFTAQLDKGFDAIIDKMDTQEKARCLACEKHIERTSAVELDINRAKGALAVVGFPSLAWFLIKLFGKHGGAQ